MVACMVNNNLSNSEVSESMACMTGRNDNRFTGESSGSRRDNRKSKRYCNHCHELGYIKEQCFKLHGYPEWYKGNKNKKDHRMTTNVTNSINDGSASFDNPLEDSYNSDTQLSSIQPGHLDQNFMNVLAQEVMKLMKGK